METEDEPETMRGYRRTEYPVPAIQGIYGQHNTMRKPYPGQRNGGDTVQQRAEVRDAAKTFLRRGMGTVRTLSKLETHEMVGRMKKDGR
jgi:hypothetical protein